MEKTELDEIRTENSESPTLNNEAILPDTEIQNKLTDADIDKLVIQAQASREHDEKLVELRESLGLDSYPYQVKIEGGYKGDWTLLLRERMMNLKTKLKFIASKIDFLTSDKPYEKQGALDKEEFTKKYHYDQIRDYDEKIVQAFSYSTYAPSAQYGHKPSALGINKDNGVVFSDAAIDGRVLNDQEKNAIEAHEKGHILRQFKINFEDFARGFDFSKIPQDEKNRMYLQKPDELAERMSQLKNYFGFRGDETFTAKHLEYAKEHYLKDGAINNDMDVFLTLITPGTEAEFLRIMNTYPL